MSQESIRIEYFNWLYDLVCGRRYSRDISYRKLLLYLHEIEFTYTLARDGNRADDGIDLRYRFTWVNGYDSSVDYIVGALDGPCSVFEMMVALAIRCEESIMDDPDIGDRTSQWFWGMMTNLGIGAMTNDRFDRRLVDEVIGRLLNRCYEPDGTGGLFTVRGRKQDLRNVEIWEQLNWYLDNIT